MVTQLPYLYDNLFVETLICIFLHYFKCLIRTGCNFILKLWAIVIPSSCNLGHILYAYIL